MKNKEAFSWAFKWAGRSYEAWAGDVSRTLLQRIS